MTSRISVRRDATLDDALRTLASAGWSVTDAVRTALGLLADAHESAWDVGAAGVGQPVDVTACTVEPRPPAADVAA